jgi:hypothetical protein
VDRRRYRGVALILGASLRTSKPPRVDGGESIMAGRHRSDAPCPAVAMVAGCGGMADRRGLLPAGWHAPRLAVDTKQSSWRADRTTGMGAPGQRAHPTWRDRGGALVLRGSVGSPMGIEFPGSLAWVSYWRARRGRP